MLVYCIDIETPHLRSRHLTNSLAAVVREVQPTRSIPLLGKLIGDESVEYIGKSEQPIVRLSTERHSASALVIHRRDLDTDLFVR